MLSEDLLNLAVQLDWAEDHGVRLPAAFVSASLRAYVDRAAALEAHLIPLEARITPDVEEETGGRVVHFGKWVRRAG